MAWTHRRVRDYHEWSYEERRRFRDKEVWAKATVDAASSDSDAPANWEVERDGSPVARGHARTVTAAKKASHAALWKARRPRRR